MKHVILSILIIGMILPLGVVVGGQQAPSAALGDIQEGGLVVTPNNVNLRVRAQPRQEAAALQTIPAGTSVPALGRNQGTSWIQVEFRGVIGWVSRYYVTSNGDLNSLPITDGSEASVDNRPKERVSAPDGTLVDTGTLVVFSNYAEVNIRTAPRETAAVVTVLQPEERATVTTLSQDQNWGFVPAYNGWIALYVVNVLGDIRTVPIQGEPNSGAPVPVPESPTFSLEQREIIQSAQDHFDRYFAEANTLVGIFENAVGSGFISCGPRVRFMRPYRPSTADYAKVGELEPIVSKMNDGFEILNRARAPWVTACEARNTLLFADRFDDWLNTAYEGRALLQEVQVELAALSAK